MYTEINKKYLLGSLTLLTIGITVFGLFKYKKITIFPCSSIEQEIDEDKK